MNWDGRAKKFLERGKYLIKNSRPFSGKLQKGLHKEGVFGLEQEKHKEARNIKEGVELCLKGLFIANGFNIYSCNKFGQITNLALPSETEFTVGLKDIKKKLNLLKIDQKDKSRLDNLLDSGGWLRQKSGDASHGTADSIQITESDKEAINRLLEITKNNFKI